MREKLKAAYSVNDFDELSRRADTENKLLVKQHYVSRYNPGSASTITLGWLHPVITFCNMIITTFYVKDCNDVFCQVSVHINSA